MEGSSNQIHDTLQIVLAHTTKMQEYEELAEYPIANNELKTFPRE